ncbi:hypothetical protein Hokovirus_3_163 [Hokovirus HKV1]|uniref:Uncharacterized protein n=1 Tax=Hokovirus HKV1 TaxID=1977638 RepID=A0A1V0SGN9_9VIRU|nr:hypothetical protein Hokovirus_3_163 [Hokovirus HKV1]
MHSDIKTNIIIYKKNVDKLDKLYTSNEATKNIDKMIKKKNNELLIWANNMTSEYDICVKNLNIIYENVIKS